MLSMKRYLSFRNGSIISYIYGQAYTSSSSRRVATSSFYWQPQRYYSVKQAPVDSSRQEYPLTKNKAYETILHLESLDFSAARKIIADSKPTTKPINEQQCDEWLCKICHILMNAENSTEYDWFVENIIFARNYASEKALMMILSHQLDLYNDLEKATEYFVRIVKQFKQTPWVHLLLTKLIRQGHDMNIERVIKAIESLHSRNLARSLLAHAYTDCGHIEQASQIYSELPKFRLEKIKILAQTVQNQWKIKFLNNFLISAKDCMDTKSRIILFETLIMMYSDEQNVDQVIKVCTEMVSENLKPKDSMLAIIRRLERYNIAIPNEWNMEYRWKYGPKYQLHTLLQQQKLAEANAFYMSNGSHTFGDRLNRYLLSENAKNGNIIFFQQMRQVLGVKFAEKKHGLSFTEFECKAYLKADKCFIFMQYVREDFNRCFNSETTEQNDLPISVMDMMKIHSIHNQLEGLAVDPRFQGYLRLPCMLWCYALINESQVSKEDKYNIFCIQNIDIVVQNIINILVQRQRIDKLEDFLNDSKLNKSVVKPKILGEAYSKLFDYLYKMGKYDSIFEHFQTAAQFIDEKDFNQNTFNKLKLGNDDFNGEFRSRLWRFYIK